MAMLVTLTTMVTAFCVGIAVFFFLCLTTLLIGLPRPTALSSGWSPDGALLSPIVSGGLPRNVFLLVGGVTLTV